jgi:hypothetical protein
MQATKLVKVPGGKQVVEVDIAKIRDGEDTRDNRQNGNIHFGLAMTLHAQFANS